MLKRVRLKTWVVEGRREARTVLAIKAAFVESEAGNLVVELVGELSHWPDVLRRGSTHFASGPAP
jgi:hypothetical protein